MHQQPGYWNGNKRSAVRKFGLGDSDTEFPVGTVSCDRSHLPYGTVSRLTDRSAVTHAVRRVS
jgi:hypothetical protein